MSHAAVATATGLPTGRVAIWWFLASEIAIFGGGLASFLMLRAHHPEWASEAAHTMAGIGAVNTTVLLTSSLGAVLADRASRDGEHARAALMLRLTAIGGVLFLGFKAWEYAHEIAGGLVPSRSLFWSFYYVLTGLHGLHVLGGTVALLAVANVARTHPGRVECVAIYWHFVDVIWIFLFPLLYLAS